MNDEIQQILNRKLERRKQLAALPVGEKLRMLEEMVAAAKAVSAVQSTRAASPVLAERGPVKRSLAGPESENRIEGGEVITDRVWHNPDFVEDLMRNSDSRSAARFRIEIAVCD